MNDALALAMADFTPATAEAAVAPTVGELVMGYYEMHQREVFSVTLRACRDREVAEDLVQEAFLRLIVEVEAGRTPDNVRAWLHRVTANLVVTRSRRTSVARKWSGFLVGAKTPDEPEAMLLDFERRSDLEAALAELPADARTALLLAARGFTGLDIAAAIGRSGAATRTLMCRARVRIRERLTTAEAQA
jgi:RNA polymerase sigma-70 factor (ECF subfamily)